jgi:hypothetical protein
MAQPHAKILKNAVHVDSATRHEHIKQEAWYRYMHAENAPAGVEKLIQQRAQQEQLFTGEDVDRGIIAEQIDMGKQCYLGTAYSFKLSV